jgi:Holliday junction resolvase RusA-like endonuclease
MKCVSITIPGKPFAKQRARVTKFGAYTPKETVSFERIVGQLASLKMKSPFFGPVKMVVVAQFVPPASWSAKKRAAALGRYHIQKPDLDNIEKAVCDGLNRIGFEDDAQVAVKEGRKVWAETACTIVTITELGVEGD